MLFTRSAGIAVAAMLLAASGGIALMGQAGAASQEKAGKTLKKAPITFSKPESGAQMWKDYCAACGRIIVQHVTACRAAVMGQRLKL
jgi:hypothetical protein